jgi:integrase
MRNVFVANCCEMRARTKKHRRPLIIQVGNFRVPIYRDKYKKRIGNRVKKYERYTLAYYRSEDDGETRRRRLQSFSRLQDARFEAQKIATAIANGEADMLKLKSTDRASYVHAIGELKPLGIPLHVAISEYVEAKKHAGAGLVSAAKDYSRRHTLAIIRKTVGAVVEEFLDAKEQDGMSLRYRQTLRSHLNRFAKHFRINMSSVSAAQIEDWLRSLKRGPRTRNNIRLSILTLFNFARARGYLPKSMPTEAEHVAKAKDRGGEIEIFRPKQLAQLFDVIDEEAKLYFAIGAFTGLRSAELIRLDWGDVNCARGHIQVAKHKAKTATRRLVPIQSNLAIWLAPYRSKNNGRIFASEHAADRAIAQAKELGIKWPNNVLRHSYATYRLAQCHDAARVALEMGNSPQMLFRNYRELADEKDAADWFNIVPSEVVREKIIPLRRAR